MSPGGPVTLRGAGQAAREAYGPSRDTAEPRAAERPSPAIRVPAIPVAENVARGQAAVGQVSRDRGSVPGAMVRQDFGEITFDYGRPGDPARDYLNGYGLSHIIARRNLEGVDGEKFVHDVLPAIVARGRLQRVYGPPNSRRAEIVLGDNKVILSLYRDEARETWVVTGFGAARKGRGRRPR